VGCSRAAGQPDSDARRAARVAGRTAGRGIDRDDIHRVPLADRYRGRLNPWCAPQPDAAPHRLGRPAPGSARLAWLGRSVRIQLCHRPPHSTARTCRVSSSTTRSARRPGTIAPRSVSPSLVAGVVEAIRTASTMDTPAWTIRRSAASVVNALPASTPPANLVVCSGRATESCTSTGAGCPPTSYRPSGMPAAGMASVIRAVLVGPADRAANARTASCRCTGRRSVRTGRWGK